jgi:hypothetical protein
MKTGDERASIGWECSGQIIMPSDKYNGTLGACSIGLVAHRNRV